MSRGCGPGLVGGAAAAVAFNVVTFYVNGWPGPPGPRDLLVTSDAGSAGVPRCGPGRLAGHPGGADRPAVHDRRLCLVPALADASCTIRFRSRSALLTAGLYQACLAHLALAWPYGRLRSRLDRVVVAVNYGWNIGNNAVGNAVLEPAHQRLRRCLPGQPAAGRWLQPAAQALSTQGRLDRRHLHDSGRSGPDCPALVEARGYVTAGDDVADLGRGADRRLHWPSWTSRASLGSPDLVVYGIGPLILIAAPAAYAVGMFRARSARGAVGAALVGLEPGPAPARLRDALAKALGDPTLQLAFRRAGARLLRRYWRSALSTLTGCRPGGRWPRSIPAAKRCLSTTRSCARA